MEMKISSKKKVLFGTLKPGDICALCFPGIDETDKDVFLYMCLDEKHSCDNAVILFPKQYQGRTCTLNKKVKVISVSGKLEIDNFPTVSDFQE